jgi:hypothetical protein
VEDCYRLRYGTARRNLAAAPDRFEARRGGQPTNEIPAADSILTDAK